MSKCARFKVVDGDELTRSQREFVCVPDGEHFYAIVDVLHDRVLGTDYAEPEDKLLVRDFSWVADELNKLAGDVAEMASHGRTLVASNDRFRRHAAAAAEESKRLQREADDARSVIRNSVALVEAAGDIRKFIEAVGPMVDSIEEAE